MLGTPSSQHGLFYLRINSSANIPWSKKKKRKKGVVLNPLRPSFVLKKYQPYDFFNFERSSPLDPATRKTTTRKRWFKVFPHILKKSTSRKTSLYLFFTRKVSTVFFFLLKEIKPSPEHNYDKTSNSWSCFRHYGILAKTFSNYMFTFFVFFQLLL